ncbi:hypothetical protein ZIOFF_029042 [Zingiber officinale]|uniref:PXMP2/4 family protein 4 n=2 Tax=Zingiber officinale TaxID=94328 RepID=A0A8J5GNZ2_ZINOF|nr:hypothetical protein ZIOFF_029042 [Zingiber officinale]
MARRTSYRPYPLPQSPALEMSGGVLRHVCFGVPNPPLSRFRAFPLRGELPQSPSTRARAYVRPHHLAPALSSAAFFASSSWARSGFVNWYLGVLSARPILTKSLTAAATTVAADLFSQIISSSSFKNLDFVRIIRMAGYGMLISGPSLHFWFNFVSRILPKHDILTTFKKMALGQTIYGPIITGVFFSLNAALQGETVEEIFARLNRDMLPALKSGIMYWPICDFITFKFIPIRLQPLVSNLFTFVWTVYMTYMASLEKATTETILAM